MDQLYFVPETDDVLVYKTKFIENKYLKDTNDPDAGMVYYMAWFDKDGSVLGYVEKCVFSTDDNSENIVIATLDNDTDGGIFQYDAVSLGNGKEDKPYQICYRVCDINGVFGLGYLEKRGINNKEDFIRYYGDFEKVEAPKPQNKTEKKYLKDQMKQDQVEPQVFATYPLDYLYFVPSTEDYTVVEDYNLEMEDTFDKNLMMEFYGTNKIKYDISVLRSFDNKGNEVSKIKRYVFTYDDEYYAVPNGRWNNQGFYQSDARDCFLAHFNDGKEYSLLKQVDNVVYIVEKESEEQNLSKAKWIDLYNKEGHKYYASIPIKDNDTSDETNETSVPKMKITGKVTDYDFSDKFSYEFVASEPHKATFTLKDPFISDSYVINQNGVKDGTYEYSWSIEFGDDNVGRFGINTNWSNEFIGCSQYEDDFSIPINDMNTSCYYNMGDISENYYEVELGEIRCETIADSIVWTITLPYNSKADLTKIDTENKYISVSSLNNMGYSIFPK